jgi:hypothetical protein
VYTSAGQILSLGKKRNLGLWLLNRPKIKRNLFLKKKKIGKKRKWREIQRWLAKQ